MFGKKKVDSPAAVATAPAPDAANAVPSKAPKAKRPAGPSTPATLGDIAVIGSCILLIVTLVFELLALKAIQFF